MKIPSSAPTAVSHGPTRPSTVARVGWLLPVLLLLGLPAVMQAQLSSFFPVASNAAAMGVAFDGSNYLVGLQSFRTTPNSIDAQMVSSTGSELGSPILTGRTGVATAVAFDGTHYLVIWEDDGLGTLDGSTGWQIYGQFISKAGTTVGTPFAISTTGIWFDGIKTMAFGAGKYLVTYTRLIVPANGDASNNRYIAGRIVNPDGTMGSEFRISSGYGDASDVAFDGTNFFVVWCEDSSDTEIRGCLISPAGVTGTEIAVNASSAPSDNPKSVTFDGVNYLVVWNDEIGGPGTGQWDVYGQFVSTTGTLVGGVIPITTEPGPQIATSVASDGINCFAVWVDMQNATNWDAYGQFIGHDGALLGGKVTLSTAPGNQMVSVGFADGHYLVGLVDGVVMGPGGIQQADSSLGAVLLPLPEPQVVMDDGLFGVRTNQFGFTLSGTSGQTVVVEACTNLANPGWQPVQTNTFTGATSYFSDPTWMNHSTRFYRLRFR